MSSPLLLLVLAISSWCRVSAELKLYVQNDTIEGYTSDDAMLPVTYEADAPPRITWSQNCDFENHVVWCNLCTQKNSLTVSPFTGYQFQGRLNGFEQNGSIIIKNLQMSDAGQFCVSMSDKDGRNIVYGKINLHLKNHIMPRSVKCPVLQEGPLSGIIANPIPGLLINNVDFIHIPVVLNFSDWKMADINYCVNLNMSSFYASLLEDIISDYQGRSQDLTRFQMTSLQSGVLHLSSSQQGFEELAKPNKMSSQFAQGMSIWNKFDIEQIMKHINYFQSGGNITNSVMTGIRGLANEDNYTIYNMMDLINMLRVTKVNVELSNKETPQSQEINKSNCNIYGSFVLNIVKTLLKDVENGQIPDVITDEELAKFYCPNCASKVQNHKQFWECVTSCKKIQFNTIRKLGSVTPHPNKVTCYLQSPCPEPTLYISFTLSLPVFNIATSVFDKVATIQSVGLLEDNIFKERLNIPPLVIFNPELKTWLTPNTDCCSMIKYKYVCRCDVFAVRIPACGQIQNESDTFTMTCPVKLTKWQVPIVKVTQSIDGLYCVVTNQKQYLYGNLPCNITSPNFCFFPRQYTVIGHTVITKEDNSTNAPTQNKDVFLPQFNVHIGPLTLRLKKLLEHKNSHLIQISNSKDGPVVNEMIIDADNNLINNSFAQIEIRIRILIVIQVFVILIVLCMLYCLCNMLKHQGFKLDTLFTHPYLRISK